MDEPEAMRIRVVPVSVMPAVDARIGALDEPYVIDWSMPTYSDAGLVEVIGLPIYVPSAQEMRSCPKP